MLFSAFSHIQGCTPPPTECDCLIAGPAHSSFPLSPFLPPSVGLTSQSFSGEHIRHGMPVLILLMLCTFSVSLHWDREQRGHNQMSWHLPEIQPSYSSTLIFQNLLFQVLIHGMPYPWNFLCIVELASSNQGTASPENSSLASLRNLAKHPGGPSGAEGLTLPAAE